jgi:CheY-like chemotaxis protein
MEKPSRSRSRRKVLLVVEDEKLIRWSIRQALRSEYLVRAVSSAEEAMRVLPRLRRLDGILVDVRLPGMNGLDFIRKARESRPDAKVFVMTAYNHDTAARQAFGVQADAYLSKPFELQTLKDMLASHLRTASQVST